MHQSLQYQSNVSLKYTVCHEPHEASGHLGEEDIGLASSAPCKGCGSAAQRYIRKDAPVPRQLTRSVSEIKFANCHDMRSSAASTPCNCQDSTGN